MAANAGRVDLIRGGLCPHSPSFVPQLIRPLDRTRFFNPFTLTGSVLAHTVRLRTTADNVIVFYSKKAFHLGFEWSRGPVDRRDLAALSS
jgi:hypothetical protein